MFGWTWVHVCPVGVYVGILYAIVIITRYYMCAIVRAPSGYYRHLYVVCLLIIDWYITALVMSRDKNCLDWTNCDINCWSINDITCWYQSYYNWQGCLNYNCNYNYNYYNGCPSCWRTWRVRKSASYGIYMGMVPITVLGTVLITWWSDRDQLHFIICLWYKEPYRRRLTIQARKILDGYIARKCKELGGAEPRESFPFEGQFLDNKKWN